MDEQLITKILKKDKKCSKIFLGVFARDELPKHPSYPSCFIFNTHPRSKPGEHWLALFYSENGFCQFFDSYGYPPSFYRLETYLTNTSTGWNYNARRLQGNSDFCGIYSILFLLYKSRNKTMQFFKEFYLNYSKNDRKIFTNIKRFLK